MALGSVTEAVTEAETTMFKSLIGRERVQRLWVALVVSLPFSLVIFNAGRGKLDVQSAHQAFFALVVSFLLGLPLFCLFRVCICWLAFWSHAKGYGATAVGVVLCIVFLIGFAHVVPMHIGMACLPLGLIGGILGSLEAKDKSQARPPGAEPV